MHRLDKKVILVTGAARGIGAAMARLFVAEGARVMLIDVLSAKAETEALAGELGEHALYQRLDVTDEASWRTAVSVAVARWGRIDGLVNNAGVNIPAQRLADTTLDDFHRVLDVNLVGPFLGIKHVSPVMLSNGSGSIVNIVSIGAMTAWNGLGAYCASKWGVRGLTRVAAMELGHKGVRVNAIFPGGVNTTMGNMFDGDTEALNQAYKGQPIQRIGEPIEIAWTCLFLLSDDASYTCGAELVVDGGNMAGAFFDGLPGAPEE